jgi:hypothetical protein
MTRSTDRLIAIDGVNGNAMSAVAKSRIAAEKKRRVGISYWDASGIFGEVVVAEDAAGRPSARTLLLLYAADLAFRLRWEIGPALDEGRLVIAAPYVATPIALGQAAGLDAQWLADIFHFAPPASEHHVIDPAPAKPLSQRQGFVEFAWRHLDTRLSGLTRLELMDRTRHHLRASAQRSRSSGASR